MGVVGTIFSILISILVIGLIIWLVVYPEPLKKVLSSLYPSPVYDPNKNARKVSSNVTFYTSPISKGDKLIVIFIGGGGMFSKIENFYGLANQLNEYIGPDYDIVLFSYPVRFKNNIHDAMVSINKTLMQYIHYTTVHAVGISFGALLAGAFYQKETTAVKAKAMNLQQIGMRFSSLSILSGMIECKFNADILTKLFIYYIMDKTPGIIYYTCYGVSIPKLIISASSDFLVAQTAKFIQTEPCEYKIFQSTTLPHSFAQFINLEEGREAIKMVSDFIKKTDKA